MKIKYLQNAFCILLMLSASGSYAQGWQLFGEGRGNEVRLLWTAPEWSDTIQGMHIKRRVAGGTWTSLTATPVYPLISPGKKLDNVSNDPSVIASLRKMISEKPADYAAMDSMAFLRTISATGGLGLFTFALAKDFNKALITGFAYYDRKPGAPGTRLEYGLFPVDLNGKESGPIATFTWKAGELPRYDFKHTALVRGNKKKGQVRVEWKINTASYLSARVLQGFNIDRIDNGQRTRLTKNTIWPNTNAEEFPVFIIDNVPADRKYTYELVPLSVLGYESAPLTVVYDPAQVPGEYKVSLLGRYTPGDTAIALEIQVPAEAEKFISSYEVEEKVSVITYKSVLRPFTGKKLVKLPYDTARSAPDSIRFRLKCSLRDGYDPLYSNDLSIYYNPKIIPAKTSGLKGELVQREGKQYAALSWKPVPGAASYYIYKKELNGDRLIWEASLPEIRTSGYEYLLKYPGARTYTFAVAAVDRTGNHIGELSDPVQVTTPTQLLMRVWFKEYRQAEDRKVLLTWEYEAPADLAGYRLYENGRLVADEKVLKKGTLQWKSAPKEAGRYDYTIEAVTVSGAVSERSFARAVVVK